MIYKSDPEGRPIQRYALPEIMTQVLIYTWKIALAAMPRLAKKHLREFSFPSNRDLLPHETFVMAGPTLFVCRTSASNTRRILRSHLKNPNKSIEFKYFN
jgi:hypothetical protein